MSDNKPPYDATIENIHLLCSELRDVSGMEHDDLEDEIEEIRGSTFDRTLEAAVKLGLFEDSEQGYKPTTEGKKIGYGRLSDEEEEELFRSLVAGYDFYQELLEIVGGELTSQNGEQYLERDVVQSEIGINFDLGLSDRILESAAGTFLQVLDECGVGDYTRGQGDYPTRLVVNEEYSEFLSELTGEEETEQENKAAQEQLPIDMEDSPEQDVLTDGEEGEISESIEDTPEPEEESSQLTAQKEEIQVSENIRQNGSVEVNIDIEVSSADWNSEEVISLINSLNEEEAE